MSTSLYVFLDAPESEEVTLPQLLQDLSIPGYSFSTHPLRSAIDAPGEPSVPTRGAFYAQNYFRIFLADRAVQFYRDAALPPELAAGEQYLLSAILTLPQFNLRRWIVTDEGWDDEDEPYVTILDEGTDARDFWLKRGN
jgi:hypothetical protein